MSFDLDIHPVRLASNSGYALSVLRVAQNYTLFDAIRALNPQPIPSTIYVDGIGVERIRDGSCAGERTFGKFDRDAFGDVYTWIRADDLARAMTAHIPAAPETAYVRALPPDQMVVLGWG